MTTYKYLIIGGGMAGDAAVQGIRDVDTDGSIGLVGAEPHPPYNRPPLSKGLWKGEPIEGIERTAGVQGADLRLGREIVRLDPDARRVTDSRGDSCAYDRLLLATGGSPRRLPFGEERIVYFRTRDDYQRLRTLAERGDHFAVIGGGFIGSEIAAALAMNGKRVSMLFPDAGIGARVFPPDLAGFLNDLYRQKGVEVLTGASATGLEERSGRLALRVRNDRAGVETVLAAEGVVAGVGIQPNVQLAEAAGLEVNDGIRVNRALQTSRADIYAAGDVANFHCPALDRRIRVEHEDNAITMGRAAGQSMAGRSVSYDHLPFFYSDLFELGYEAVGETDSRLEMVSDWKEPHREGVIYYLRERRVRGVLLWNVWGQVDAARKLIAEPGPFDAGNLQGRLPA